MIKNKGDTMIEVMICLVVAGMMIGSVSTLARKSTININTARERVNALKIAETQAELIRTQATAKFGAAFCFDTNSVNVNAPCTLDTLYTVRITPPATNPTPDANGVQTFSYLITVTWSSIGGGANTLTLPYAYAK